MARRRIEEKAEKGLDWTHSEEVPNKITRKSLTWNPQRKVQERKEDPGHLGKGSLVEEEMKAAGKTWS